jgi:hypothetical protein
MAAPRRSPSRYFGLLIFIEREENRQSEGTFSCGWRGPNAMTFRLGCKLAGNERSQHFGAASAEIAQLAARRNATPAARHGSPMGD